MDLWETRATEKQTAKEPPAIPGTDFILRPGRDRDANKVLTLMREVFIDEMGWNRAFLVDAARTLVEILTHTADPGTLFLVCYSGKKVIGVLTLLDVGGGTAFIRWLVVHRDARGAGLGRLFVDRALAFAKDAGFARVRLVTVRALSRALDFYLKAGFNQVGTKTDTIWGMPLTLCFMEIQITS